MKKNFFLTCITVILATVMFYSCQKDGQNETEGQGEVVFLFSNITQNNLKSSSIDDAANIIISIKDAEGKYVYELKELPLVNFNGSFITNALALKPGTYQITQYIVADANGNAIYATPIETSELAYLVSDPLPITFTIKKDEVTKVVPEVISVEGKTPKDFGYATFSFSVVETFNFSVGVFIYNDSTKNYQLTEASLLITNGDTLVTKNLTATTNNLLIKDGYNQYIIKVSKEGYTSYVDTISNADMKLYYDGSINGPLIITLQKATTSGCILGTVTDIDGNVYRTVKIGDQIWMAENLRTTHYNDGTEIPMITYDSNVMKQTSYGAYSLYDNDPNYLMTHGGLYNWYAIESNKLQPEGWHIASTEEWLKLFQYVGEHQASKLSSTTGWLYSFGTDEYCFSAKPISNIDSEKGFAQWWTTNIYDTNNANVVMLFCDMIDAESGLPTIQTPEGLGSFSVGPKAFKYSLFSIRCVKN